MIDVRIGTTHALEVREDAEGNQSTVPAPGERTITFLMPDGVSSMDASAQVIAALNGVMMEVGSTPWWIESNDQAVATNLASHYGVELNQMPERWGDGSTTDTPPAPNMLQSVSAPPPDPQLPSAPVVEPEAAEPEPEPEAEPEPEPEPEMTQPESEPEQEPEE